MSDKPLYTVASYQDEGGKFRGVVSNMSDRGILWTTSVSETPCGYAAQVGNQRKILKRCQRWITQSEWAAFRKVLGSSPSPASKNGNVKASRKGCF
jgi:hypothetical protein